MTADEKDPSTDGGIKVGVDDDELPEDLQPAEDNPLAEPADDEVDDDLLTQDVGQAHSRETAVDGEESHPDESPTTESAESADSIDESRDEDHSEA